ncbi:hypothetical protein OU995_20310 [Roseateles sp. SL47]|nr:hypothetical protein [Roseateles sp. SL47]WAC71901.1 hypothetical protein OU995_20310 [Roseateles sp. SL47]
MSGRKLIVKPQASAGRLAPYAEAQVVLQLSAEQDFDSKAFQ